MQVKVSNAAPAVAFDRPNTTSRPDGRARWRRSRTTSTPTASRPVSSSPVPTRSSSARPPTTRPTARTSSAAAGATARPTRPPSATATPGSRSRAATRSSSTPSARHRRQLAIPLQPKGMHDEMNSASFDEWGRMTANLGLEAPGATPLLQNIILYPYVNPATEMLDSTGHAEQPRRDAHLVGRGRDADLEDHPQRRRHAPDPLPPVRRAGASTG